MSAPLQSRIDDLAAQFPGTAGVSARNLATGEELRGNDILSYPTASMISILLLFEMVRESANGRAQAWTRTTLRCADNTFGTGLLSALRRGELVPTGYVEQVLDVMRIQKYIEPIRKLLPADPYAREFGDPEDVWVASKTGGLKGVRTEAGLVHTPRAEWALCVMTK